MLWLYCQHIQCEARNNVRCELIGYVVETDKHETVSQVNNKKKVFKEIIEKVNCCEVL